MGRRGGYGPEGGGVGEGGAGGGLTKLSLLFLKEDSTELKQRQMIGLASLGKLRVS